jgi:hypothetical protein
MTAAIPIERGQSRASLDDSAIIESTESSNRLEGITLPRSVLERIVREAQEPKEENRSEGEIAGYRSVLQLIHERNEHMDLTPNLVLQLHRDLFVLPPHALKLSLAQRRCPWRAVRRSRP